MLTDPDTWTGGGFELLVCIPGQEKTEGLTAMQAVWDWPDVVGPFRRNNVEVHEQVQVSPDLESNALYGVATLPNSQHAALSSHTVVEDKGLWIYAGCPLGSLARAYPSVGAFPWEVPVTDPWVGEMSRWLFGLAQHVYSRVPFPLGMIGWLTVSEVDEIESRVVPKRRYHSYIVESAGKLAFFGPNVDEPLMR